MYVEITYKENGLKAIDCGFFLISSFVSVNVQKLLFFILSNFFWNQQFLDLIRKYRFGKEIFVLSIS